MKLFKNDVGRPSNQKIRERRLVTVALVMLIVYVVAEGISWGIKSFSNKDSVTSVGKNASVTKLYVKLVSSDDGKLLAGGKLRITYNGKLVKLFTTTANGYTVSGLVPGRKYVLLEDTAPSGYELSYQNIEFTYKKGMTVTLKNIPSGDVTSKIDCSKGDGKLTWEDYEQISRFYYEESKYNINQKNADIDGSGKVDHIELQIISSFLNEGRGDIDKDGKITTSDARLATRYSVGMDNPTQEQKKLADINRDGKVDTDDARIISRLSTSYGDVCSVYSTSGDGKITREDLDLIALFSKNVKTPTNAQRGKADLNKDGKIDYNDLGIVYKKLYPNSKITCYVSDAMWKIDASNEYYLNPGNNYLNCEFDNMDGLLYSMVLRKTLNNNTYNDSYYHNELLIDSDKSITKKQQFRVDNDFKFLSINMVAYSSYLAAKNDVRLPITYNIKARKLDSSKLKVTTKPANSAYNTSKSTTVKFKTNSSNTMYFRVGTYHYATGFPVSADVGISGEQSKCVAIPKNTTKSVSIKLINNTSEQITRYSDTSFGISNKRSIYLLLYNDKYCQDLAANSLLYKPQ